MFTLVLQAVQAVQAAKAGTQAAAHATANGAVPPPTAFSFPDHWPAQGELLTWTQEIGPGLAALMVLMGVVYLLFGFNIFKGLVVLNAAAIGGALGWAIGEHTGGSVPLSFTCAFIFAVVTYPMMKWAVAIMGGLCGAAIGVSLWRTFNLDPAFAWTGSGMGVIFFGLLTFILFRGCVMTYMSLQGAAMLVFGAFALLFKYDGMHLKVNGCLHGYPFLLPMMVFIPTVLGVVFQQHHGAAAGPAPKK